MKALVYMGPEVLSFQDMPDPQPERGEVLIKVAGVGICGSDMHAFLGHDERRPAPLILGHEVAGTIAQGPEAGRRSSWPKNACMSEPQIPTPATLIKTSPRLGCGSGIS